MFKQKLLEKIDDVLKFIHLKCLRGRLWHDWIDEKAGTERHELHKDGMLIGISYTLHGVWHKENGPAIIYFNKDGGIKGERYYLNGRELSEETVFARKNNLDVFE